MLNLTAAYRHTAAQPFKNRAFASHEAIDRERKENPGKWGPAVTDNNKIGLDIVPQSIQGSGTSRAATIQADLKCNYL
jgi:hypothetical protein